MTHQEVALVRIELAVKYPSDPAAGTYCRCWRGRPAIAGWGSPCAFSAGAAAGGGGAAVGSDATAGLARGLWIPSRSPSSRILCTSSRETAPWPDPRSACTRARVFDRWLMSPAAGATQSGHPWSSNQMMNTTVTVQPFSSLTHGRSWRYRTWPAAPHVATA
jgi:hypothetical protein